LCQHFPNTLIEPQIFNPSPPITLDLRSTFLIYIAQLSLLKENHENTTAQKKIEGHAL